MDPPEGFMKLMDFVQAGETCLVEGTDKVDMCYEYNIRNDDVC